MAHIRGRSGAGLADGLPDGVSKLPLPDVALVLEESGAIEKAGSAAGSSSAGDSDGLSSAVGGERHADWVQPCRAREDLAGRRLD